jgi:hypothetical protein
LSEYKKKRDFDKEKANFKTLGNNGATSENRDGQTAFLTAENLEVKVTVLADTGSDYSAVQRSAVEDARKRGFPLNVEMLPEPIELNMAIRGESDKQTCSAKEILMSAVTITTPSGPLYMRGVRQIIVEEDMDHPLMRRQVLGEMGTVASQIWTLYGKKSTCTTSATMTRSYCKRPSSLWTPCQSFHSSLRTLQSFY